MLARRGRGVLGRSWHCGCWASWCKPEAGDGSHEVCVRGLGALHAHGAKTCEEKAGAGWPVGCRPWLAWCWACALGLMACAVGLLGQVRWTCAHRPGGSGKEKGSIGFGLDFGFWAQQK